MRQRYDGKTAALLTQHGKETLLAPILEPLLGCEIQHVQGYDTDQLGTFSGAIKRLDSQIETARKKALIGMDLAGSTLGVASEGAFVSDPWSGLMPWNIEVLVWVDRQSDFEVVGIAQGPTRSLHQAVRSVSELEAFAQAAGFPQHHLVLRPQNASDPRLHQGIADWDQLKQTFRQCQEQSSNACVYAENDHRAFCHPTRQAMIQRAAQDLVKKFESICPRCSAPGFAASQHTSGLLCRSCGSKTRLPVSYTMCCNACHYTEEKRSTPNFADPSRCDVCNP